MNVKQKFRESDSTPGRRPGAEKIEKLMGVSSDGSRCKNPQTLIGKKAGKKIKPGDRLQVRNPDGFLSEQFTFTGS